MTLTAVAEARQQQILRAAASCFAKRGFHQATMQDICREAELSPGSVYRYYRSKEELIAALVEQDRAEYTAKIKALRAEASVFAGLQQMADMVLELINDPDKVDLNAEMGAESRRNPEVALLIRNSDKALLDSLAEILALAQKRGEIDPTLEPRPAAEMLMSVIDGLSWRKMIHPDTDAARYAGLVHLLLSRFLQPAPAEASQGKNQRKD